MTLKIVECPYVYKKGHPKEGETCRRPGAAIQKEQGRPLPNGTRRKYWDVVHYRATNTKGKPGLTWHYVGRKRPAKHVKQEEAEEDQEVLELERAIEKEIKSRVK